MQTHFTLAQLADPDLRDAEQILRACVHCGMCTATCPTYLLRGDEGDSPRGRITLIQALLESGQAPTAATVSHLDRCLGCLSCESTCPSGVSYGHLLDHGRRRLEQSWHRPWRERLGRALLVALLTRPGLLRLGLSLGLLTRHWHARLPAALQPLAQLLPHELPPPSRINRPRVHPAAGPRRLRVALLPGCAQQVLGARINEATVRLLTRLGAEVVVPRGAGCCGALALHLGYDDLSQRQAAATLRACLRVQAEGRLDAIVVANSGCGATVKDYAFQFRHSPAWAEPAAKLAALARDVTEVVAELGLKSALTSRAHGHTIAYHAACTLHHGQKVGALPQNLLREAGFTVRELPEAHLCCGSAGTYNLLQPELAAGLRQRKQAAIASVAPEAVAAGNLGCLTQLSQGADWPLVHTAELLDWATGGPVPAGLEQWGRGAAR